MDLFYPRADTGGQKDKRELYYCSDLTLLRSDITIREGESSVGSACYGQYTKHSPHDSQRSQNSYNNDPSEKDLYTTKEKLRKKR